MSGERTTPAPADIYQTGHFLLTSGLHSSGYVQVALLLQDPARAAEACHVLASRFRSAGVEAVIGPAVGAIVIAYEVARQLRARALWTERVDGRMTLRRSFGIRPGERVLIVEDVITTGGSVSEVRRVVEEAGGLVVGIGALVDRSETAPPSDVPFVAAMRVPAPPTYAAATCPLCAQGVPLSKPGTRAAMPDLTVKTHRG